MTTGPRDPETAGRDRLWANHADREQVIEALKAAFVHGRLTRDELGARAGQALIARTSADLAALTFDIPLIPATAKPARRLAPVRRPLARAAAGSGGCLVTAAAAVWAAFLIGLPPSPYDSWAPLLLFLAFCLAFTALGFFGLGVVISLEQRHPPRAPGGCS